MTRCCRRFRRSRGRDPEHRGGTGDCGKPCRSWRSSGDLPRALAFVMARRTRRRSTRGTRRWRRWKAGGRECCRRCSRVIPVPGDLYLYDITSSYFEGVTCPWRHLGTTATEEGQEAGGAGGDLRCGGLSDLDGCVQGEHIGSDDGKAGVAKPESEAGIGGVHVCGDRGMVTHARIEELEKEGWWEAFSYITALTRHEMMALVRTSTIRSSWSCSTING